jgi:hypothetical protein
MTKFDAAVFKSFLFVNKTFLLILNLLDYKNLTSQLLRFIFLDTQTLIA